MTRSAIAHVDDVPEGGKALFLVEGQGLGVFKLDGRIFVWRNTCPHQGGPVCQGRIFKRVIDRVGADGQVHGRDYDNHDVNIVCPWHGAEFDIRTGRHAGTNALSLTPVPFEIHDGEIHVDLS